MNGEVLKELSDWHKDTILYYALPKMKEANTEPIEMSLKDLFQCAINIKEAAINPGKDAEGNPQNSKDQKTKPQFLGSRGVKVKTLRRVEANHLFLRVNIYHLVIFVAERATPKQHAALSKNQWPLLKRTLRTEVLSGKRIKLERLNPLFQQLQLQSKKIVLVKKMRMTRTNRLL
jgi:hypothetical protein